MRKGFTFSEMVALLAILTFVSLIFAPVFATLITDIPGSYRVVQENTSVLSMLKQMRTDIDAAKQLPLSFAGHPADDKVLLIESKDGYICYELKDGKVLRRSLSRQRRPREGTREDKTVWSVPNAKVEWQVWRKNTKGYAVEVKTHVEQNVPGGPQKKMANSHLYFVRVFREVLR